MSETIEQWAARVAPLFNTEAWAGINASRETRAFCDVLALHPVRADFPEIFAALRARVDAIVAGLSDDARRAMRSGALPVGEGRALGLVDDNGWTPLGREVARRRSAMQTLRRDPARKQSAAGSEMPWTEVDDGYEDGCMFALEHCGCHLVVWGNHADVNRAGSWTAGVATHAGGPEWTRSGFEELSKACSEAVALAEALGASHPMVAPGRIGIADELANIARILITPGPESANTDDLEAAAHVAAAVKVLRRRRT